MPIRRVSHLVALIACIAMTAGLTPTGVAQAASPTPVISPPAAFDAPIGKRGGATNPHASCGGNYSLTPRMRWRVVNDATGAVTSFGWFDAYPGMRFPRLEVGTYTSKVVVRCRGTQAARTHRFTIQEKTAKGTISYPEFRRVKVGMPLQRVRRIVGNAGVDPFSYGGNTNRTFHQMRFWAWSVIEFRHGRVHRKFWNVGHD